MTAEAVKLSTKYAGHGSMVFYKDIMDATQLADLGHPHGDYSEALESFRSLRQTNQPDGLNFLEHGTQLVKVGNNAFRQDHFVVDHSYCFRLLLLVQYDPFGGELPCSYKLYYSHRRSEVLDVTLLATCEECTDVTFVAFAKDVANHLLTIIWQWLQHTLGTSVREGIVPDGTMLVPVVDTLQQLRTLKLVPELNMLNRFARGVYPVESESPLTELPPELCFNKPYMEMSNPDDTAARRLIHLP